MGDKKENEKAAHCRRVRFVRVSHGGQGVETKVHSGTGAREAESAVEREGHYNWLPLDMVKKTAWFLCSS